MLAIISCVWIYIACNPLTDRFKSFGSLVRFFGVQRLWGQNKRNDIQKSMTIRIAI